MRVLVVNAGSSSLKLDLLGVDDETLAHTDIERWDGDPAHAGLTEFVRGLHDVDAVGHRVVHGGDRYTKATRIDAGVVDAIRAFASLAPLHQPRAIAAIDAVRTLLPEVPAVACFDTAFHATMPPEAATYALPAEWNERFGLRRYGFHGLSHAWASRRAAELTARPIEDLRIVTAHLGAGASLCAVAGGRSVATTMGFTPLEGVVMATRAGDVDPGLVLWLVTDGGMDAAAVTAGLEHGAGLLGLSGTSGDMRDVLHAADAGDDRAALAYRVWCHRLRAAVAGMAAAMNGLDVLVFTGGIGEHSRRARTDACAGLTFLGVRLDPDANEATAGDGRIGAKTADVETLVVTAREDRQIAGEVRTTLAS